MGFVFPNENQLLLFCLGLGAGDLLEGEARAFPESMEMLTLCFSNALAGNKSYRITLGRLAGFNPQIASSPLENIFFLFFLIFVYFNISFLLCKISRSGFVGLLTGAHESMLCSLGPLSHPWHHPGVGSFIQMSPRSWGPASVSLVILSP